MWGLRASMPRRSMWRVAQFDTLRLRLVKIAARGMRADYSWARPGQDYHNIYHHIRHR